MRKGMSRANTSPRRLFGAKIAITLAESNEIKLHYLACHGAINHTPFTSTVVCLTVLSGYLFPAPVYVHACVRYESPIRFAKDGRYPV